MNYYDVLRVDKNASQQEIKDSYKKLIKRYHPDLYPGNKTKAETITRDLNEAYEVLSDPEKKEIYDLNFKEPIIENSAPKSKYYHNTYSDYNQEIITEETEGPNFEQKLHENIHSFVNKQSQKLSSNSKNTVILILIFFILLILLLTAKDYIDFQYTLQRKQYEQELEKMRLEMMRENFNYFENTIEENTVNE